MRAFILLVGLIVFFIDDDQAEIGIRQKQRRTRADNNRRIAGSNRSPVARTGARRQLRMPLDWPHAKTRREAIEKLPRQRDLRHQNHGLAPAADIFRNRLEIDFRLARACHAIEQRDLKLTLRNEVRIASAADTLLWRKIRLRRRTDRAAAVQLTRHRLGPERAFIHEAVDDAGGLTPASRATSDFACKQSVRQ
jgi:hypothetical protein